MSISDFLNLIATDVDEKISKPEAYEDFASSYDTFKRQYKKYWEALINKEKKNEMIFGKPYRSN